MDGFRTFDLAFKLSKSKKSINISNILSNKYKSGDNRYPEFEDDLKQRDGKVYFVRRGVGGKSDEETRFHHWAIAVKFYDGKWVTIEGVIDRGLLVPAYSFSYTKPSGTIIDIEDTPNAYQNTDQAKLIFIIQMLKSVSLEIVRRIEASPRDLHALAGSIPIKPYCLGVNDCQTWFLDALRKLQFFEIGTKSTRECVFDTIRAPTKILINTIFKAASTVTNTGLEALNTVGRVISLKENPVTALVDGVGKAANHIITGVYDTAAGAVDGVAGFAVNAIGMATGGGCATKNSLDADTRSLQEEVRSGRVSKAKAMVQGVGKFAGRIIYGVANTTTNFVGGVADTATGLVSGWTGTVAAPFKALDSIFGDIARGKINPLLGIVAAPVMVVRAVAEGVGKTVANVRIGVINTMKGIFKGFGSIF